jgi:hypothetical protein
MWKIILIEILVLSIISSFWDDKIEKQKWKKRKYKVLAGITYFLSAGISVFLAESINNAIYWYTLVAVLIAIGCFLSAINPNLRNIYTSLLVLGGIALLVTRYISVHPIIVIIADIFLLCMIILSWHDSINYIRLGIDPDVIEEEKEKEKEDAKKIKRFKRKLVFNAFKIVSKFL